MAQDPKSVQCPGCGQKFAPAGAASLPDGSYRCPSCRKEFLPQKSPQQTARRPAAGKAAVLLPVCPICSEGPVVAGGSAEEEELYTCRTCESLLSETIFGFRYKKIDPRFEKRRDEYQGHTFTRVDLLAVSDELLQARRAADGLAKAETAGRPAKEGEDLWWTLDEEELARRGKRAPRPGPKKDLTVDDLLDELKRQS